MPQIPLFKPLLIAILLLSNFDATALEFLPGIGVGLEYTDNVTLSADNPVGDLIGVGYVGAKLEETDGPVVTNITAALNHVRHTKDIFRDRRYFNLNAEAGWEMIDNRFDWFLSNYYRQRPINTTDPNTPDNIQDSNWFNFGANIVFPISARQTFTLIPVYRNFYYEFQATDSQTFSLTANWNYVLTELTNVGINFDVRRIVYDEEVIVNSTFTSIFFVVAKRLARSNFTTNLGATGVERDNGQSTEEFAGNLNWEFQPTGLSRFRFFISTDLTNTSEGTFNAIVDPGAGNPNDIQITADVVRNQVLLLGYFREYRRLNAGLVGQLQQLTYSETPNDRRIRTVNAFMDYPVSALLTSGLYGRYRHIEFIDTVRTDNDYIVGGNLQYRLSRNLSSVFDLRYRSRVSSQDLQSFNAWSAYVNLVYGFGYPQRPTGTGGF